MWLIPLEQAMFSRRTRGSVGRKMPTKEAIRFASAVAAMKCTQRRSGRHSNREQTESFLSLYA